MLFDGDLTDNVLSTRLARSTCSIVSGGLASGSMIIKCDDQAYLPELVGILTEYGSPPAFIEVNDGFLFYRSGCVLARISRRSAGAATGRHERGARGVRGGGSGAGGGGLLGHGAHLGRAS